VSQSFEPARKTAQEGPHATAPPTRRPTTSPRNRCHVTHPSTPACRHMNSYEIP
jgi:hypothetical protein